MLVDIFINGDWDTSIEDRSDKNVIIYDKGKVYQMDESLYDSFIDNLELSGYDCYFCPQLFAHPQWSGIMVYDLK